MIEVRRARSADAAELARLRWRFRADFDPAVEERSAFVERCRTWMRRRLAEAEPWRCWVAVEGRVVGHVWVEAVEKVPNPVDEAELHAYLTNMYVIPDLRGRGIGTRLLAAALEWCRERDVGSVVLWPTERSRSLYGRHGFRETGNVLELPLKAPCNAPAETAARAEESGR